MKNGKHLLVDAYNCEPEVMNNPEFIKGMLLDITEMIGLRPLSEPLIYIVDETMIQKKDTGITGGIIFMESHFTFHAFPEQRYFSADIYSCKDFKHKEVLEYFYIFFASPKMDYKIIKRGTEL